MEIIIQKETSVIITLQNVLTDINKLKTKIMATFSHKQSFEMFTGKFVISNNDGTIWTADCAEIISNHKPEYDEVNYPTLECKFPITRGFGVKKVKFVNLEKTSYTRGQFSNTFRRVDLISKNVEKLVK